MIVAEGRPAMEVQGTAIALAAADIPTTLVADALAPSLVSEAAMVVAGADAVTSGGAAVNKAGTLALALAARHARIPMYVLCETLKLWPYEDPPPLESSPGETVWPESPRGVESSNVIFDVTPGRLVTAYVTEEGIVDRRWIAEHARALSDVRRKLGLRRVP